MKKVLVGILIVSLMFAFCGCGKERTDISDYQYMYDGIVTDWNKYATPGCERETLLGFGEYLYNSQLIFFPRETPSTLNEFYFHLPVEELNHLQPYSTGNLSPDCMIHHKD